MGCTHGDCSVRVPDKIMKVAQYQDFEKVAEVNISGVARKIQDAVSKVDDDITGKHNLPHFKNSIGIPDSKTLEKNLMEYYTQWNKDCVRRMLAEGTSEIHYRVDKLAKELGVEDDLPKAPFPLMGGSETL